MHTLGFIHVKNRSTIEEMLLTEIWKLIGGANDSQVKAENVLVVLAGVLNLQVPEFILTCEEGHENHLNYGCVYICLDEFSNAHYHNYDDVMRVH